MDPTLQKFLGPSGLLAKNLKGYEYRPQQVQMAALVRRAMDEGRCALVEAGTGTGKTLAYLIPALLSGKRVVVSTATKTLQDQIVLKDIPLIRSVTGMEFSAKVLKGRQNYLCMYRLEQAAGYGQGHLLPKDRRDFDQVVRWSKGTPSGEWSELSFPESSQIRKELSCTSEACPGRKCPYSNVCFVTRARREAAECDLIIVNHHLLFADLALKTDGANPSALVIPAYENVVFDEAHAVEDVATDFFGLSLSHFQVKELVDDATRAVAENPASCPLAPPILDRIFQFGNRFFNELGTGLTEADPVRRLFPDQDAKELQLRSEQLAESLRALPGALERLESLDKDVLVRRARQLAADLDFLTSLDNPGFVYWEERRGARNTKGMTVLRCAPIDVAGEFRRRLYANTRSVVFTSATLASEGRLDFTRRRLGLPGKDMEAMDMEAMDARERALSAKKPVADFPAQGSSDGYFFGVGDDGDDGGHDADVANGLKPNPAARKLAVQVDELVLDSPFDFTRQAALYTPAHLPDPNAPDFVGRAAEEIDQLCQITRGRALLLFTSLKNMTQAHAILKRRLPGTVMLQGEAPKAAQIQRMKEEPCVLFASHSFWEGVDIPGEALSLVVIDRLPFASPSDPVVSARVDWLKACGQKPFVCYQVPQAALALRQGFGRLIRTRRDRGIVAVLDPRLTSKHYGRSFLKSLPPAVRCTTMDQVKSFYLDPAALPVPAPLGRGGALPLENRSGDAR